MLTAEDGSVRVFANRLDRAKLCGCYSSPFLGRKGE